MPHYAVLDTNVLVSSLLSRFRDSATVLVIDMVVKKEIIPVYSRSTLNEYTTVLRRPKFQFCRERAEKLLSFIRKEGLFLNAKNIEVLLPDPKDLPFYEIVMEKKKRRGRIPHHWQ